MRMSVGFLGRVRGGLTRIHVYPDGVAQRGRSRRTAVRTPAPRTLPLRSQFGKVPAAAASAAAMIGAARRVVAAEPQQRLGPAEIPGLRFFRRTGGVRA